MKESNIEVLFEDNHLIIVNKRCSDIVQGDKTGDIPLGTFVKEYIKNRYNKPGEVFLGVTHRLDRPTSGALIFARTSKALTRLNKMFQSHTEISKKYWAVVDKKPPQKEALLEHWMVRNTKQNKSYAHNKDRDGAKKASLSYKYITSSDRYHLIEVTLHTGRHHQIRSQLAAIDLHIKGDLKYGAKRPNKDGGIHLHAREISFIHPVGKERLTVVAPPPNDPVWNYFKNL